MFKAFFEVIVSQVGMAPPVTDHPYERTTSRSYPETPRPQTRYQM